jgi:uncharacterized protein involved in copper resistance
MKSLRYRLLALLGLAALTLSVSTQQASTSTQQQDQGMQAMPGMQGPTQTGPMQHGSMDQMMQNCQTNMKNMQHSNNQAKQDIEAAKRSNDPAKMRAALDEAEKALTSMDEHMTMCMSMMNMHSKAGMMSGQQEKEKQQTAPQQ